MGYHTRRTFLRTAGLASAGLALLVACAPQGGSAPSPAQTAAAGANTPATQAQAAAGAPKRGGTLRVGLGLDAATLDPHLSGSKLDRQIYHNLHDPLVTLDEKLQIQPNLAESWQTPDPKTLILKLRSGVKFHDGTDFTADAVKINFDRMANDPKSVRKGEVANIASSEVVDPLTIKLNLKQADSSLLAGLTDRAGMILSPTALTKLGADFDRNPVGAGTGPFEFVEWVKDDHILLKRNANYWNKDASSGPYLDQVRFRPIPDDTVKQQSLQAGEIDAIDYVTPRNVAGAKSDSSVVVVDVPSLAAFWVTLNTTKPPFDNKAFRQAALYAVDIEAIVKGVWLGVGVPANGPISPASWAYDDTIKPILRDLAKAKAKLVEGGSPDGFSFTFNAESTPLTIQFAEVLKAQLAEANITMNVNVMDSARYLAEGNGKIGQAALYSWSGRPDPDGNVYQFFHTIPGNSLNWSGISNPELDRLLDQTRQVTDHAERKKLYSQALTILRDEAPALWI
ncbi:MAG TPA: ABC transporter substrate-binding protein, partial [Chloroflexota bacterium]|nr:ABC transporter substrate-binding protein [Chloroflexota bacterium]